MAAEYAEASYVRLTFDRAIDIAGLAAGQVVVDDGPVSGWSWVGIGSGTLIGPTIVEIELGAQTESSSPGTVLNASAATGIVAVDDGGAWAGATNLPLPFP